VPFYPNASSLQSNRPPQIVDGGEMGPRPSSQELPLTRDQRRGRQMLFETHKLCYTFPRRRPNPRAPGKSGSEGKWSSGTRGFPQPGKRVELEADFFIFLARNPLISPDSEKLMKTNESFLLSFPCFYLLLFERISPPGCNFPPDGVGGTPLSPWVEGWVGVRADPGLRPALTAAPSAGRALRGHLLPRGEGKGVRARARSRPARPNSSCHRAGPRR
jgi:hypothetical protein